MAIQLQPGVNLNVITTEKYKTIRMYLRFSTPHTKKAATQRTLLTSLLETSTLNYPTQTALSAKLAELYGASFGLNVSKRGQIHQVNVGMTIVNGKYLNQPDLFSEAVQFLREVLFYPHIKEGRFDEALFELEKSNLQAYLASLYEDKQTLASLKLQELYFGQDEDQKTPSFSGAKEIETVTNETLVLAHQALLAQDQIDIFVVGDITQEQVLKEMHHLAFPLTDRTPIVPFYKQALSHQVQEARQVEEVLQGKLNLGYATNVYYDQIPERFALSVFNGLFGGFPHSKLFMNVREKASLAYYASSSVDFFRGFLSVQTGIDTQNKDQVLTLITEQLNALQAGDIREEELSQTKAMLKNQFLLSLDNPQALIETAYHQTLLPQTKLSDEEVLRAIEAVTKEQVQTIAQQIQLQAIFFLDGDKNNE